MKIYLAIIGWPVITRYLFIREGEDPLKNHTWKHGDGIYVKRIIDIESDDFSMYSHWLFSDACFSSSLIKMFHYPCRGSEIVENIKTLRIMNPEDGLKFHDL